MSHNPFMQPTKFDLFTSLACVSFVAVAVGAGVNPIGRLESYRDDERTAGVRAMYSAIAQFEQEKPDEYQVLLARLDEENGQKVIIGDAETCSGYWGKECLSRETAESCLRLQDYVGEELLPAVPIAPGEDFSHAVTGYYLQMLEGELMVGACNPSEGEIVLPAR